MYVKDVKDTIINLRVHSTVYRIYVEDVEDFQMYMYLFKEDDPDKYKTWFELGADIGLEIVDDEEVEGEVDQIEVDQIEVDEEVARMYEDAKEHHRKIMTGGFKWIHVEDVEDTVYGIQFSKWYACGRHRRY